MKRAAMLRRSTTASTTTQPKVRQCAGQNCEATFEPRRMEHTVCSPRCLIAKRKADEKAARDGLKTRKAAIKTIPDLIKEAQREFNQFIRRRDAGKPCICCGRPLGEGDVGGAYDCGHYRSTGSASHLRFHEQNAAAQRKACNRWGAGRAVDYRIGLVARIGREAVEALEADNQPHKWTRDELIAIRDTYRAKLRELLKGQV